MRRAWLGTVVVCALLGAGCGADDDDGDAADGVRFGPSDVDVSATAIDLGQPDEEFLDALVELGMEVDAAWDLSPDGATFDDGLGVSVPGILDGTGAVLLVRHGDGSWDLAEDIDVGPSGVSGTVREFSELVYAAPTADWTPSTSAVGEAVAVAGLDVVLDGATFGVGDVDVPFSIQSISKVLTLALVLPRVADCLERVLVEPSGDPFNSLVQLEFEGGIPRACEVRYCD